MTATGSDLLSPAQRAALHHVEHVLCSNDAAVYRHVTDLVQRAGRLRAVYDEAVECIRHHARVVVHFHPDRVGSTSVSVAEGLLREGIYRSQFETGLSSGSVSAVPGGARDEWERTLFGGAYHGEAVGSSERPKYGALELVRYPDGPIPRFGSSYFVLSSDVTARTTFTFMGSEDPRAPQRVGTARRIHAVMAALFSELEEGGMAYPAWPPLRAPTLGVPNLTVAGLLALLKELPRPRRDPGEGAPARVLDTQIEAQVHGPLELRRDIELLVADPAFAPTPAGAVLHELAARYQIPLRWHRGFRLAVRDVPADFRGPAMPRFAERIAGTDGTLDAATIGSAQRSLHEEPESWREWGTHAEVLDLLKQLWHVLVHHGDPGRKATEPVR